MRFTRLRVAAIAAAMCLSLAGASTAQAQTTQEGLVNLSLDNTNVQVPVAVAANICGVAVNVIASSTLTSPVDCTADGVSTATRQNRGGGPTRQSGLVNVAITDTNVQIPIGIAANVCGVSANVIAQFVATGPVTCDALADAEAGNP
jgi:hypothetical protein